MGLRKRWVELVMLDLAPESSAKQNGGFGITGPGPGWAPGRTEWIVGGPPVAGVRVSLWLIRSPWVLRFPHFCTLSGVH